MRGDRGMKIDCSNCSTTLTLDPTEGTITYARPASGRGSKRVPATTIVADVWTADEYLLMWDAPCCTVDGEPYADSYEEVTA